MIASALPSTLGANAGLLSLPGVMGCGRRNEEGLVIAPNVPWIVAGSIASLTVHLCTRPGNHMAALNFTALDAQILRLFAEAGQLDSFRNVILNPVRVPPFLRVYLHTIELHGKVNMVATGHPGLSAQPHDLSLFHHVSVVYIDSAEVTVDGLQTVAMIEDNAVAVDAKWSGIDDFPIIGGFYSDVLRNGQIVSQMNLLIDLPSVIDVIPDFRETRLGLGMSLPDERVRP